MIRLPLFFRVLSKKTMILRPGHLKLPKMLGLLSSVAYESLERGGGFLKHEPTWRFMGTFK